VASFHEAVGAYGFPASLLTDNGAVFTAVPRKGRCAIELETAALGIRYVHSSPYHAQTCGKVERVHQTLKRWLAKHEPAATIRALQDELDRFVAYYNEVRPHRGIDRRTPAEAFSARPKATPSLPRLAPSTHVRVRRDKIEEWQDHASTQFAASSHRAGPTALWHPGHGVGRWAPRPRDHRRGRANPGTDP
jgi:hypothetical protein